MSANPTEMIPQSRIRSGERVRVSASFQKNPTPLGSDRDGTTGWWQFIEVFCKRVMSEGDIFRLVPRARSHLRYVSSNQLAQLEHVSIFRFWSPNAWFFRWVILIFFSPFRRLLTRARWSMRGYDSQSNILKLQLSAQILHTDALKFTLRNFSLCRTWLLVWCLECAEVNTSPQFLKIYIGYLLVSE